MKKLNFPCTIDCVKEIFDEHEYNHFVKSIEYTDESYTSDDSLEITVTITCSPKIESNDDDYDRAMELLDVLTT